MIVDLFKQLVNKVQMLLRLKTDSLLAEHMVIPADPKADRTIHLVGDLCIGNRIIVKINDIIQSAHHDFDDMGERFFIFDGDIAQ